jgi:hypothetical protein
MLKETLSKADIFYIQNNRELPAKELAKGVGTSVSIIRRVLEQMPKECTPIVHEIEDQPPTEPTPAVEPPKPKKYEKGLKHIINEKQPGVVVMNKTASEHGDEASKAARRGPSDRFKAHVGKAYPEG